MFNKRVSEYCLVGIGYVDSNLVIYSPGVQSVAAVALKLKATDLYKRRSSLATWVQGQRRAVSEPLRPFTRIFNTPAVRAPTKTDLHAPCSECGDVMQLQMVTPVSGEPNQVEHIFVCAGCNTVDIFSFQKMATPA